jgi:superfamily II DNA/RNA helicase
VILANTRELIRQTQQVMNVIGSETNIKLILGEKNSKMSDGHVLITVPGFLNQKLIRKNSDLDLSACKMVILDEADELLVQQENDQTFLNLKEKFEELKISPQYCCFSATYTDQIKEKAQTMIGKYKDYPMKKECLRLKGVQNFKMLFQNDQAKLQFVMDTHTKLMDRMTMIFVNEKKTASFLQQQLAKKDVKANILVGGLDAADRDKIID